MTPRNFDHAFVDEEMERQIRIAEVLGIKPLEVRRAWNDDKERARIIQHLVELGYDENGRPLEEQSKDAPASSPALCSVEGCNKERTGNSNLCDRHRCRATTTKGERCKNPVAEGSQYCEIHLRETEPNNGRIQNVSLKAFQEEIESLRREIFGLKEQLKEKDSLIKEQQEELKVLKNVRAGVDIEKLRQECHEKVTEWLKNIMENTTRVSITVRDAPSDMKVFFKNVSFQAVKATGGQRFLEKELQITAFLVFRWICEWLETTKPDLIKQSYTKSNSLGQKFDHTYRVEVLSEVATALSMLERILTRR